MRQYINTISLVKNSRGVWDLDTSKGCACGIANNPKGCYGDCYAASNAARYGIDFSKTTLRYFENKKHEQNTIEQINMIDMPFIRIGVSGDPSECWEHTLNICEIVSRCNLVLYKTYKKSIVIITKHWHNLTYSQLNRLTKLDVYINTSVSALDSPKLLANRMEQYNIIKGCCKSVLRIVSCNFNVENKTGKRLSLIQDGLFNNDNVIDTIFRPSLQNKYVTSGVINIEKVKFLSKLVYASVFNKNTYFGHCSKCPEMCGLNLF